MHVDDESVRIDAATVRHPELFALVYELRDHLGDWIDHSGRPHAPDNIVDWLRLSVAIRTWHIFKAVVPLVERDLWEDGQIIVRCLFELLLNVEYIEKDPSQREALTRRFFMYEQLQDYQQTLAQYQYAVHTGRAKPDDELIARIDRMARELFPMFITSTRNGETRWAHSWCGLRVSELARASTQPIREWQYRVLYSYNSAFVHATPMSVLSTCGWRDNEKQAWEEFHGKTA